MWAVQALTTHVLCMWVVSACTLYTVAVIFEGLQWGGSASSASTSTACPGVYKTLIFQFFAKISIDKSCLTCKSKYLPGSLSFNTWSSIGAEFQQRILKQWQLHRLTPLQMIQQRSLENSPLIGRRQRHQTHWDSPWDCKLILNWKEDKKERGIMNSLAWRRQWNQELKTLLLQGLAIAPQGSQQIGKPWGRWNKGLHYHVLLSFPASQ